jgi:hypothetical protein
MNRLASRLTLALSAVAAGAAVRYGLAPLVIAGGLLLAFVLPGLALTDLIVRRRTVGGVERAVLAPALSLALVVLGGLAVFSAGVELTRASWTTLTVGTTLVALVGAASRQRFSPDEAAVPATTTAAAQGGGVAVLTADGPDGDAGTAPRPGPGRFALRALPLLLAAAVLGGAVWLTMDSIRQNAAAPVTALSVGQIGPTGANNLRPVAVTVTGLVRGSGPYRITVTNSTGVDTEVRTLDVPAGTWTGTLLVPATDRISINLYRSGDAAPYRTTLLSRVG